MKKSYLWLLLVIMLVAAAFRMVGLTEVPPGLTHDEADHGQTAWGVVNGERPIYFTVGYGREPIFDYASAGLMSITGPSFLAGRLTAVFFSLIMLAGTSAWVSRAFGPKTALFTAAGLAIGFYAVMTGRQALRSITLPAVFVLAVYFFWRGITSYRTSSSIARSVVSSHSRNKLHVFWTRFHHFLFAGILLGLTIYTYPPARIMWVMFPVLLLFLYFFDRRVFNQAWPGTFLMLLLAVTIAAPLVLYVVTNSSAEVRLTELSAPLQAAVDGDFGPLIQNVTSGLKLLFIQGDSQWRYNIPGRPVLDSIYGVLFVAGLILSVANIIKHLQTKKTIWPAAAGFFTLVWLILALSPAQVTGADLSTTRIIGLLPVLYLYPATLLSWVSDTVRLPRKLTYGFITVLFLAIGALTVRDYFYIWADSPEVRVQYERTAVTMVNYVNENGYGQAALSTTTPNNFHSPAVGLLINKNPDVSVRWFDGQHSLLIPGGTESTILFSGFSPLNRDIEPYFFGTKVDELPLRGSDLDRPITVYRTDGSLEVDAWLSSLDRDIQGLGRKSLPVIFGDKVELLAYKLLAAESTAGDRVQLLTAWRTHLPVEEAVVFVHLLGQDGQPLAQEDRLDVPSYAWEAGDLFLQLHEFDLPADAEPGKYPITIGVYNRSDLVRLSVSGQGGVSPDHLQLTTFKITE